MAEHIIDVIQGYHILRATVGLVYSGLMFMRGPFSMANSTFAQTVGTDKRTNPALVNGLEVMLRMERNRIFVRSIASLALVSQGYWKASGLITVCESLRRLIDDANTQGQGDPTGVRKSPWILLMAVGTGLYCLT